MLCLSEHTSLRMLIAEVGDVSERSTVCSYNLNFNNHIWLIKKMELIKPVVEVLILSVSWVNMEHIQ